jgi:cell division septal protein FtsQ
LGYAADSSPVSAGRAHARMQERREAVSVGRGRRRLVLLALVLVLAVGAGAVVWARSSDAFQIKSLVLSPGRHVTEAQLRTAAGAAIGANLLRVDLDALTRKVAAIPYVQSARVYRRFPDALEVQFEEYEPAAVVQAGDGRRWLVAEGGRVLETERGTGAGKLALIVPTGETWPRAGGVVAPRVVAALPLAALVRDPRAWPASHPVKHLAVDDFGEVVLVLGSGAEVRIGEPTRLQQKLMVAAGIIDRKLREGRRIDYVDVRDPSWAVAKPTEP